ncbi:PQ loop repeat-domain-containing protein [Papiliotrema laurentii]|uniref:PQ loop repeat-domain-containing protein n=1 Tax=Papiliotrema laurentii TaxID=5418 RepID=A0AAD9CV41_PAPLA|nr:PQ loop repeat-domain-containing protein [Papiliotrema laurentii]
MSVISSLAAVGMAVGPPLVYADQAYSIVKKKDSSGFSHDVCGVVIIANITRVFFWLGNRFETPLLIQSILLIISQLFLLSLCLHYAPLDSTATTSYAPLSPLHESAQDDSNESGFASRFPGQTAKPRSKRPFDFWQWEGYGTYLEFLAGYIVVLGVLQVIFGRWSWYIDALGFIALTIESTLPIPQFISNWRRKSTYGFRISTLAGWFFGDAYKTVYFFLRQSPLQFKVTAIMTLCWDTAVAVQRFMYGSEPPRGASGQQDDHEERERLGLGQ